MRHIVSYIALGMALTLVACASGPKKYKRAPIGESKDAAQIPNGVKIIFYPPDRDNLVTEVAAAKELISAYQFSAEPAGECQQAKFIQVKEYAVEATTYIDSTCDWNLTLAIGSLDESATNSPAGDTGNDPSAGPVTYAKDIKPYVDASCTKACHNGGAVGQDKLNTYADLKKVAEKAYKEIEKGTMPQGGPKASDAQIKTFKKWIDDGLQEKPASFAVTYAAKVNWEEHIKPFVEKTCAKSCHNGSGQGASKLVTYEDVKANAAAANDQIKSGTMPVGGSTTAEEKALFAQWVKEGMPEKPETPSDQNSEPSEGEGSSTLPLAKVYYQSPVFAIKKSELTDKQSVRLGFKLKMAEEGEKAGFKTKILDAKKAEKTTD